MQAPIARSVLQALAGPASKKAQASAQAWAPVLVSSFATETSTTKSSTPTDYSLVMKKAAEISSGITKPVEKEVGLCSGAPMDTYARQARIYQPARTASQQGYSKTGHNTSAAPAWKIGFDTTGKWENPLIGWTSTADTLENVGRASLFFYTKEQAIDFCKKHGWTYSVEDPNIRRDDRQKRFASYGDNFSTKRKGVPDLSHLPSMRTKSK